jgi:tRNA G10  N-methylase Trm11
MTLEVLVFGSYEFIPNYQLISMEEAESISKVGGKGKFILFLSSVKQLYKLNALFKTSRRVEIVLPVSVKRFNRKWKRIVKELNIKITYKRDLRDFGNLEKYEREEYLEREGIEWTVSKLLTNFRNVYKLSEANIKNSYWLEKYLKTAKFAPCLRK